MLRQGTIQSSYPAFPFNTIGSQAWKTQSNDWEIFKYKKVKML